MVMPCSRSACRPSVSRTVDGGQSALAGGAFDGGEGMARMVLVSNSRRPIRGSAVIDRAAGQKRRAGIFKHVADRSFRSNPSCVVP